jgi:Tfp pilus assembly protein PilX
MKKRVGLFVALCVTLISVPAVAVERQAASSNGNVAIAAAGDEVRAGEWPVVSKDQHRKVTTNACVGTPCTRYQTCSTYSPKECVDYYVGIYCRHTDPIKGACLCSRC